MIFTILSNELIAKHVWRMRLAGAEGLPIRSGQFVEIAVPGQYLRRPISVCDYAEGVLTIIYKVVGVGTDAMSQWQAGQQVDMLIGLGNGYDLSRSGERPLLIGGGVGVPPLYMLARVLREQGKPVRVILGFNTKDEVFYEEEFRALGCAVEVTTVDGTYGTKGFVTEAGMDEGLRIKDERLNSLEDKEGAVSVLHQEGSVTTMVRPGDRTSLKAGREACVPGQRPSKSPLKGDFVAGGDACAPGHFTAGETPASPVAAQHGAEERAHNLPLSSTYYYACGPLPMLKAVIGHWGEQGEVSMEERMGCGFGACMGCSIQTTEGTKRVCKDGPVFSAATLGALTHVNILRKRPYKEP